MFETQLLVVSETYACSVDLDDLEARGLYDPSSSDAAERLVLIGELLERGATLDEIEFCDRHLHIAYVPLLVFLRSEGVTIAELSTRLEVEAPELDAVWRTAGLPPFGDSETVFSEADVAMLEAFGRVGSWIGEDQRDQLLRVVGASCARIAESAIAAYVQATRSDEVDTGHTDLERMLFNERAVRDLQGAVEHIDAMLAHHLRAALTRWRIAGEGIADERVKFAIGFVDLVGYTPLASRMPTADLARLVDRLEATALDAVSSHNGRVVKLIGDEVMFVALDASAACDIALTLVEDFQAQADDTTPRGGLAIGTLLAREGDFYGPAVNVASRITEQAVPNEILVSDEIRTEAEAAGAPLRFEAAGRRMLKGFDEPVQLWAAQRV